MPQREAQQRRSRLSWPEPFTLARLVRDRHHAREGLWGPWRRAPDGLKNSHEGPYVEPGVDEIALNVAVIGLDEDAHAEASQTGAITRHSSPDSPDDV